VFGKKQNHNSAPPGIAVAHKKVFSSF